MAELAGVRREETQKTQVDPETAERFIAEKRIGERIKKLRLKKSMGLVELGKHTGLSASFLSQLETGRVVPTLRNLSRIAMVFSKDLSYFFETEPNALFRILSAQRARAAAADGCCHTYLLLRKPRLYGARSAHGSLLCGIRAAHQGDGTQSSHASWIRVSVCARRRAGDTPRRAVGHAGAGRCPLLRLEHAPLVPLRREQTGGRNHRDDSSDFERACNSSARKPTNNDLEANGREPLRRMDSPLRNN